MTNYPTPTVPAVRAYLVSIFTTAVADFREPTCEVYPSQPDHDTTEDFVVVGEVHRQTPTIALVGSGGQFWQHEMYTVNCEIAAFVAGAEAFPDVDIRAYAILAALERAVRLDPSAGGLVLQMNPESSSSTHEWDEEGRGGHCNIDLVVTVNASY